MSSALPVTVLISGRGSNLAALLEAQHAGQLHIDVRRVVSNRAQAAGLGHAERYGIAATVLEHRGYRDRAAFDADLAEAIEADGPGLVILAGFMRVLTPGFVERFTGRMINLHPSLLPRHRGLDTHRRVLEAGEREHGASVHFVTPALDSGPVIAQVRMPVQNDDDPDTLARRLAPLEHRLLLATTALFPAQRVALHGDGVYVDEQPLDAPLLLDRDLHWPPADAPATH